MRDYLTIGPSPPNENCAQVGSDDYHVKSKKECRAYIHLLRRVLGDEPSNTRLDTKSFEHDFGTYHEVVCYYNNTSPESVDYAFKCESDGPQNWDEIAQKELS